MSVRFCCSSNSSWVRMTSLARFRAALSFVSSSTWFWRCATRSLLRLRAKIWIRIMDQQKRRACISTVGQWRGDVLPLAAHWRLYALRASSLRASSGSSWFPSIVRLRPTFLAESVPLSSPDELGSLASASFVLSDIILSLDFDGAR
jgi:hypothetical protein